MNQLKSALGKQEKEQKSISRKKFGIKNYNNSKSDSIWALDPDITSGALNQQSVQNQKIQQNMSKIDEILINSLKSAFNKQKQCSEIIFYDIVQRIQCILNERQQQISELNSLLLIEKSLREIVDLSMEQQKNFNVSFYQLLVKRIKKIKKKQKKDDMKEFDKIIGVNFKKNNHIAEFISQNQNRRDILQNKDTQLNINNIRKLGKLATNSNDDSSSKKSNSSNQGKLKNLLSSQKFKQRDQLQKRQRQSQSFALTNQSVSFSTVINQTMGVRQRVPRHPVKKDKPLEQMCDSNPLNERDKQVNEQQSKDQAFIFFRPKRSKKNH